MLNFSIRTTDNIVIRFRCYAEAPVTGKAFNQLLPFEQDFMHARVSGHEIWSDQGPMLDIVQENASVFTQPGEVVLGPVKPARTLTNGAIGIYYGEGKGLDCANIFARVYEEDLPMLKVLGERIWKKGMEKIRFEALL